MQTYEINMLKNLSTQIDENLNKKNRLEKQLNELVKNEDLCRSIFFKLKILEKLLQYAKKHANDKTQPKSFEKDISAIFDEVKKNCLEQFNKELEDGCNIICIDKVIYNLKNSKSKDPIKIAYETFIESVITTYRLMSSSLEQLKINYTQNVFSDEEIFLKQELKRFNEHQQHKQEPAAEIEEQLKKEDAYRNIVFILAILENLSKYAAKHLHDKSQPKTFDKDLKNIFDKAKQNSLEQFRKELEKNKIVYIGNMVYQLKDSQSKETAKAIYEKSIQNQITTFNDIFSSLKQLTDHYHGQFFSCGKEYWETELKNISKSKPRTKKTVAEIEEELNRVKEIIKELQDQFDQINKSSNILMQACEEGNLEKVKFVFENIVSNANKGPLFPIIIKIDYEKNDRELLAINPTIIHIACQKGWSDIIEFFIDRFSHNAKSIFKQLDIYGLTPLHYAATNPQAIKLLTLLEKKAGIDLSLSDLTENEKKLTKGRTLLHSAALFGQKEAVVWLLKRYPSWLNLLETGNRQKSTALHHASVSGHIAVCEYLLECNADASLLDTEKCTPLMAMLISTKIDHDKKLALAECFFKRELWVTEEQFDFLASEHFHRNSDLEEVKRLQKVHQAIAQHSIRLNIKPVIEKIQISAIALQPTPVPSITAGDVQNKVQHQQKTKIIQQYEDTIWQQKIKYAKPLTKYSDKLQIFLEEKHLKEMQLELITLYRENKEKLTPEIYEAKLNETCQILIQAYKNMLASFNLFFIDTEIINFNLYPEKRVELINNYAVEILKEECEQNYQYDSFKHQNWQELQHKLFEKQMAALYSSFRIEKLIDQLLKEMEEQYENSEALIRMLQDDLEQLKNQNILSDKHPLHFACRAGNAETVESLLAPITHDIEKIKEAVNKHDGQYYPIHYAAIGCKDNALLDLLKDKGANIKQEAPYLRRGRTALHSAAYFGNRVAVAWLIKEAPVLINQAESRIGKSAGHTPLHEAAYGGFLSICELLLSNGADPKSLSTNKKTPLMYMLSNCELPIKRKIKLAQCFMKYHAYLSEADNAILIESMLQTYEENVLPVLNQFPELLKKAEVPLQCDQQVMIEKANSPIQSGFFAPIPNNMSQQPKNKSQENAKQKMNTIPLAPK